MNSRQPCHTKGRSVNRDRNTSKVLLGKKELRAFEKWRPLALEVKRVRATQARSEKASITL